MGHKGCNDTSARAVRQLQHPATARARRLSCCGFRGPLEAKASDDLEKCVRRLVARVVPEPGHRDDLGLRQRVLELSLRLGRNDGARAAEDVDDRRLDPAYRLPQRRRDEAFEYCGIALPHDAAVVARPGAVLHERAGDALGRARVVPHDLRQELVD